jgi:hypothetical protein
VLDKILDQAKGPTRFWDNVSSGSLITLQLVKG